MKQNKFTNNREIKFRAWDKKDNVMREVKKIDFSEKKVYCNDYYLNDWKFEEVELMQFTGLYDKNGKEIFEGDIVKWNHWKKGTNLDQPTENSEVIFHLGCWKLKGNEAWTLGIYSNIEVIGNVYQNPELLVDKKR